MSSYLDRIKVPRLGANRFGVYYVRWSVPGPERRRVFQHSLGTKDVALAKVLALQFCLSLANARGERAVVNAADRYELDPASGVMKADGPQDHQRLMEAIEALKQLKQLEADLGLRSATQTQEALEKLAGTLGATVGAAVTDLVPALQQSLSQGAAAAEQAPHDTGMALSEAAAKHLAEEKRRGKVARTIQEKEAVFKDFMAHFGDVPLNSIREAQILTWREVEFERKNQKRPDETVSIGRLEKRRGYLARFFDWARRVAGYAHPNPMSEKMASKREIRAATTHYTPFTTGDIARLFGREFPQVMDKPDWYWVPLLGLFSGARLGELANLAVTDFEVQEGVKVYLVRKGKTEDSRRVVPIHSALLRLGLWEYVEHLRKLGQTHLFGHRPPDKRSKSVGEMWGKWVDRCGITDKSKVFHSFRSTVVTDLYTSGAPNAAAIRDTVGHAGGMRGVHGDYARGLPMATLVNTIEDLKYDLDLNAIQLSDPTFQDFLERHFELNLDAKALAVADRKKRHLEARAALLERSKRKRSRSGVVEPKNVDSSLKSGKNTPDT